MQAASMPNAIAFVAHRSRFHLPSKPLSFPSCTKRHHVENQQEHKKTFTDEHGAASVNVAEVVVPMIGEEEVFFIYLPFWSVRWHT